mgnify:CR=1 FL=1
MSDQLFKSQAISENPGNVAEGLKLFIPGPIMLSQRVRNAAAFPEFGHRNFIGREIFTKVQLGLREIGEVKEADYEALLINGSGTNGMETVLRSLVGKDDRLLCVTVGAFGDLFVDIAKANGKSCDVLAFPPGQRIDLDELRKKLEEKTYSRVAFTHHESSTGVTNDIFALVNIVNTYGAIPIVDGISAFGGMPTGLRDAAPAVYIAASQKCLGVLAGLAIILIHKSILHEIKNNKERGYVTDLLRYLEFAKLGEPLTTPNCAVFNQLAIQVDHIQHEGISSRFRRHLQLRNVVRDWVRQQSKYMRLFVREDDVASNALTAIEVDKDFNLEEMAEVLLRRGYVIDTGYPPMNHQLLTARGIKVFRIPHMGDLTLSALQEYLLAIEFFLEEKKGCLFKSVQQNN